MPDNHITRTEIAIGARAVPLVARVNRRAKRLILKVDPAAGEIHVTAPSKRALPEAIAFARERSGWIAGQLDETLLARPFAPDETAPLRGVDYHIAHDPTTRTPVRLENHPRAQLIVGGERAHLNRRLVDWMKREARKDFETAVERYCDELGKKRRAIRIGDTRTRWGSCSSDGSLSFSWRLVMAPPEILEYVAAHECAHLVHMNHSPAFWRQVIALGVDPRAAENWFETNGATLFAYGGAGRF
jgi:predicted metal-dependent hydrolase